MKQARVGGKKGLQRGVTRRGAWVVIPLLLVGLSTHSSSAFLPISSYKRSPHSISRYPAPTIALVSPKDAQSHTTRHTELHLFTRNREPPGDTTNQSVTKKPSRWRRILRRANTVLLATAVSLLPVKQATADATTQPAMSRPIDDYYHNEHVDEATALLGDILLQENTRHDDDIQDTVPVSSSYYDYDDDGLMGSFADEEEALRSLRSWITPPPAKPKRRRLLWPQSQQPSRPIYKYQVFGDEEVQAMSTSTTEAATTTVHITDPVTAPKPVVKESQQHVSVLSRTTTPKMPTATTHPSNARKLLKPLIFGVTTTGGAFAGTMFLIRRNNAEKLNANGSTGLLKRQTTQEVFVKAALEEQESTKDVLVVANNKNKTKDEFLGADDPVRKSQSLQRARETQSIVQDIRARQAQEGTTPLSSSDMINGGSSNNFVEEAAVKRKAAMEALDRLDQRLEENQQELQAMTQNRTALMDALEQKRKEQRRRRKKLLLQKQKAKPETPETPTIAERQLAQRREQVQRKLLEARLYYDRIAAIAEKRRKRERGEPVDDDVDDKMPAIKIAAVEVQPVVSAADLYFAEESPDPEADTAREEEEAVLEKEPAIIVETGVDTEKQEDSPAESNATIELASDPATEIDATPVQQMVSLPNNADDGDADGNSDTAREELERKQRADIFSRALLKERLESKQRDMATKTLLNTEPVMQIGYTERTTRNLLQARLAMRMQGPVETDSVPLARKEAELSYEERVAKSLLEARLAKISTAEANQDTSTSGGSSGGFSSLFLSPYRNGFW